MFFSAGASSSCWALPRQTTGSALPPAAVCGVSACAFQGTNGHVLVQRPEVAAPFWDVATPATWRRDRHWVCPAPHVLLQSATVAAGAQQVVLECRLGAIPNLAYIWDHQVSSKPLFPGAGFFELAAATLAAAGGPKSDATSALCGAAIPSPLPLPAKHSADGMVVLRAYLQPGSGGLRVVSSPAGFKQDHLTAAAARLAPVPPPAADATARPHYSALLPQHASARPSRSAARPVDLPPGTVC